MKKRITAALLALCLVLPLAACGQAAEPELDIDAFGEELYAAGKFGETLYALEELAVFETADAEAAAALVTKLEARNADRIENYSSYIPSEVPKLEDAVIISGGRYVVLCVAEDASGVREAAQKALG